MYRKFLSLGLVVLGLGITCGTVRAQDVSQDIIDATVGEWLIAPADGSAGCRVRLEKERTIGGMAVVVGTPCTERFADELASWDFAEPGIVFRNAIREPVIGFQEQEGGPWRTPLDVTPQVFFIPDPGDMDHVPVEKDAIGKWVLTDGKGKPLCHLTLTDNASARVEGAWMVELSKNCSATVRKTRADAWQIAEIQLVIIGGEDWVYTMTPQKDGFVSDGGEFKMVRDDKP